MCFSEVENVHPFGQLNVIQGVISVNALNPIHCEGDKICSGSGVISRITCVESLRI